MLLLMQKKWLVIEFKLQAGMEEQEKFLNPTSTLYVMSNFVFCTPVDM